MKLAKAEKMLSTAAASIGDGRQKVIKAMLGRAHGLDLCFLLDATASMQKFMDMVKIKVAEMVNGIKAAFSRSVVRVAVVLYRDHDLQDGAEICDFTTDVNGSQSTFVNFLSSVRACAQNGVDTPEDVFTGLAGVANLDWQAASRLLVHICDAPCHGIRFHDLYIVLGSRCDKYPHGDKYGRDIADLLRQLRGPCQINRYFFCHVAGWTVKMIQEFKRVIGDDGWIKDNRFEDVTLIPQEVISISRSTISNTISSSTASLNTHTHGVDGGRFVPETVVEGRPDWEKIPALEGLLYKHRWYSSLDELLTRIKTGQAFEFEEMDPPLVKIAPNPFSDEGATRRPYYALVVELSSKLMAVKRFKTPFGQNARTLHSRERYLSQMQVQTVAAQMAYEFNERMQSAGPQAVLRKVEFTTVSTSYAGFKHYNMEEYLEGNWIRYSNNAGYVNTEEYAATLQAFTHWTFERSDGQLMVTDLQGVAQSTSTSGSYTFLLCDPAIHCVDLTRFTGTNLGNEGFKLFLRSHKCDWACSRLLLKPFAGLPSTPEPPAPTVSRPPSTAIRPPTVVRRGSAVRRGSVVRRGSFVRRGSAVRRPPSTLSRHPPILSSLAPTMSVPLSVGIPPPVFLPASSVSLPPPYVPPPVISSRPATVILLPFPLSGPSSASPREPLTTKQEVREPESCLGQKRKAHEPIVTNPARNGLMPIIDLTGDDAD